MDCISKVHSRMFQWKTDVQIGKKDGVIPVEKLKKVKALRVTASAVAAKKRTFGPE